MRDQLAIPQVDIRGGFNDAVGDIVRFVPRAIAFIAILVIGWIIARLLARAVNGILERVGFDRAVERGGVKRALERSKYDASDIVAKLVFYAGVLFTLQLAFGVWGPNPVSSLINNIVGWLPRAVVAVIIVVVASAIASAVRDLLASAVGGLSYGRILADVAGWFIVALGVIAALNQIGVATTVTTPVLIAVLATVGGVIVVGVGGGLIRPMQSRLERALQKAETETGRGGAPQPGAERGGMERGAARQPEPAGMAAGQGDGRSGDGMRRPHSQPAGRH
ncbi:mechanosensitive ion channel family protein [Polymorphospora rubra]|uniref:mechanosensitive ion channel family protein n=1 Tax=Polymorphospora rubra TaxID=338584 RepID=UPI0033DA7E42